MTRRPPAQSSSGWKLTFPHVLKGKEGGSEPDEVLLRAVGNHSFCRYLSDQTRGKLRSTQLRLRQKWWHRFFAVSYSSVDYVGPRLPVRQLGYQDILAGWIGFSVNCLAHLDAQGWDAEIMCRIQRGSRVGACPPKTCNKTGADAGILHIPEGTRKKSKRRSSHSITQLQSSRAFASRRLLLCGHLRSAEIRCAGIARGAGKRSAPCPELRKSIAPKNCRIVLQTQSAIRNAEANSYFRRAQW